MRGDRKPPSLRDFDARLRKARGAQSPGNGSGAPVAGMAAALRVAIEMVATLVVGGVIGWALDRWLGTRPWLLLVFLLLGVAAGILNAYRAARRIGKALEDEDQARHDDTDRSDR